MRNYNNDKEVRKLASAILNIVKEEMRSRGGILKEPASSRAGLLRDDIKHTDCVVPIGYVLLLAKNKKVDNYRSCVRFEDYRVGSAVEKLDLSDYVWSRLFELVDEYDEDIFKELVLNYEFDDWVSTPVSVSKLSTRILDIQPNESVVDLDCGFGDFMVYHNQHSKYPTMTSGFEINTDVAEIAAIRGQLCNFTVGNANKYNLIEAGNKGAFQKGFIVPAWGRKAGMMAENDVHAARFIKSLEAIDVNPFIFKGTSGEMIDASLMMQLLRKDGKAVIVTTLGPLTNSQDMQARRHFVDNQYIEGVILLPERIFAPYTNIPCALLVLSRCNKTMRMVDASDVYTKGRRRNELSEADVEEIMRRWHNDGEHSITVDTFMRGNYPLNPKRYLVEQIEVENGVRFGDVIISTKRGAQMTAKKLDEINCTEETDIQYLRVNNIQNGSVIGEIPFIKDDGALSRYYIDNNDVILSKVALEGKVALANIPRDKRWVLGANLFAFTVDTSKAEPLYIKMYLESEQGIKAVKAIASGVAVPMIGIEELKNMIIPLPPLEEQKRFVKEYQVAVAEVDRLKAEYEAAYAKLKNLVNNGRR